MFFICNLIVRNPVYSYTGFFYYIYTNKRNVAGITFKVENLDRVLAQIDTYNQRAQDGIDDVLTLSASDVVVLAKDIAPTDDSNLKQNIGFVNNRFKKELYSHANYSAYVEFGTGGYVDVTNFGEGLEGIDLPAYAMTFFVNGKGHMHPHPFFFPAIQSIVPKIPGLIEKVLNNTKV